MVVRSRVSLFVVLSMLGVHCASTVQPDPGLGGSSGSNGAGGSGGTNATGSSGSIGLTGSPGASGSQSTSGVGNSGAIGGSGGISSGISSGASGTGSGAGNSGTPTGSGASSGDSGIGSVSPDGSSDGGSGAGSYKCFPPGSGTDFTSDGPLTATSADNASVQCTVYQPTVLGSAGCLNPVIVWGNGTTNTPSSYDALFKHFATHGFIVVAADTSNAGSGMEMLACLTYILGQNTMSGGPFQGHIDVNHLAVSGYSQGGAGALAAGEDPRFTTVLAVSPYVVISLGTYDPSKYAAAQIHPLFMISGDQDVVAPASNNQQPIFDTAPVPIFWGTHAGSTHFEVLGSGGAYAGPMTAWFRWKLMGDPNAQQWFEKPACQLCSATGWTVQTNKLWM